MYIRYFRYTYIYMHYIHVYVCTYHFPIKYLDFRLPPWIAIAGVRSRRLNHGTFTRDVPTSSFYVDIMGIFTHYLPM